jgi:hypothetical protein
MKIDWNKPLEMQIFSNGELSNDFVDVRKISERKMYCVSHGTEHADYLFKKSGQYFLGYNFVTEDGEVLMFDMMGQGHTVGEVRNKEE